MYRILNPTNAGDDVGVDFDLEVNGVVQHFCVSSEAIEDLGKSEKLRGKELIDAFQKYADRIGKVAQRKYGSPSNGRILLKTLDF
nr:hypothetical protein HUO10_006079 [Paraburkholderia busanensis]